MTTQVIRNQYNEIQIGDFCQFGAIKKTNTGGGGEITPPLWCNYHGTYIILENRDNTFYQLKVDNLEMNNFGIGLDEDKELFNNYFSSHPFLEIVATAYDNISIKLKDGVDASPFNIKWHMPPAWYNVNTDVDGIPEPKYSATLEGVCVSYEG